MAESALCCCCQDRERDYPALTCRRCWGRLAGSLRRIPELVVELSGLGYVQRDTGLRVRAEVRYENTRKSDIADEGFPDPVAYALPAGPLNGRRNGTRVSSSPDPSVPIAVDVTDLLGPVNHGAWALRARGVLGVDTHQQGYVSVATTLDYWVRKVARWLGERAPHLARERSLVLGQCIWLFDRLDTICCGFPELAEFAAEIGEVSRTLYGICGYGAARPRLMKAPCPSCHLLTLTQRYEESNIECDNTECGRILTPEEYAEHVNTLIEESK